MRAMRTFLVLPVMRWQAANHPEHSSHKYTQREKYSQSVWEVKRAQLEEISSLTEVSHSNPDHIRLSLQMALQVHCLFSPDFCPPLGGVVSPLIATLLAERVVQLCVCVCVCVCVWPRHSSPAGHLQR